VLLTKFYYGEQIKEYEIVSLYRMVREIINAYKALVGKAEEYRTPGKQAQMVG
jgi:hypothetical protein